MLEDLVSTPLLIFIGVLIASLYLLFKAADLLVEGITGYAKKLGLSDALIGSLVVAMAASSPEVISSLTGFLSGDENIGFGAILGANMVHAGFALGLLTLIGRRTKLEVGIFSQQRATMWAALMLPLLLALDGEISRVDGILLLIAFGLYLVNLWRLEGTFGKLKKSVPLKHLWRDAFIFLGCLAAILLSGRWLVISSVGIAYALEIPTYFIALIVIGIGTTIPDIAIELKSLLKARAGIGLGDLLGSLVIEFLLFFGLLAVFKPIPVQVGTVANGLIFLALSITTLMLLMGKKELTWRHGLLFMGYYLAFLAIELVKIL
jgi:cation:H+ antiporter